MTMGCSFGSANIKEMCGGLWPRKLAFVGCYDGLLFRERECWVIYKEVWPRARECDVMYEDLWPRERDCVVIYEGL